MTEFSWHRRALDCIAQGALTNSKRPECHVKGVYPTHLCSSRGAHVWDTDGKKYLDFICGLGTNLLGYCNGDIHAAIHQQMEHGCSFSLGSNVEILAAETLKTMFPFVDCMKFLKSGTEACNAAVRIARARTGRSVILSEGYHGWGDTFVGLTPPAIGVPRAMPLDTENWASLSKTLNSLDDIDDEIAGVIVEPVITDYGPERRAYLEKLREKCTKHGALLIFDEIITGFRWLDHSISKNWGIEPDLICLGKAMAGGMPLALVGGKYRVMNCDEYFISTTYAGETLSLAAARKTVNLLLHHNRYKIGDLWEKGKAFLEEFNAIWPEEIRIVGYPTRGAFTGNATVRALFFQECVRAGLLFGPSWFFNFPLAEETSKIMGTLKDILTRVRLGNVTLQGEMPASPFAERVRNGPKH